MRTLSTLAIASLLALAACKGSTNEAAGPPVALESCTGCHGSGQNPAPPTVAAPGTFLFGPGAHQAHVVPNGFRKAVSCDECHPIPLSTAAAPYHDADLPLAGHRDGVADVRFGPLAAAGDRSGGIAAPMYDPATARCSNMYCHGGTLGQGSPAGAGFPSPNNSPVWTGGTTQVACGTCHGIPPPPPKHPDLTAAQPNGQPPIVPAGTTDPLVWRRSCAICHPGTMEVDASGVPTGNIDVAGGQHIDGTRQIGSFACARCHGDYTRTLAAGTDPTIRSAPPLDMGGHSGTNFPGVGAHMIHIAPAAGPSLRDRPVACTECHAIPTSMLAHPNPAYSVATDTPVDLTWGPLATAGGSVPSYDPTTAGCSATYCHGGTLTGGTTATPIWNANLNGSQVQCDSCHGMPPATPGHAGLPVPSSAPSCGNAGTSTTGCHAVAIDGTTGQFTQRGPTGTGGALHMNGTVEIGSNTCTACHGDPSKKILVTDVQTGRLGPPTSTAQGAPADLQPAPPWSRNRGSTDPSTRGVGAHDQHLFGTALREKPVACSECHVPYNTTEHAALPGHNLPGYNMLSWGPLATANGAHPVWDPATGVGCSATYCHGATLSGGVNTSPTWTAPAGGFDGSQVRCNSCHGDPPPAPHEARTDCATCHTGYTSSTVNRAIHMDGKVDATGGSCSACHGDPTRTPAGIAAAPPANARLLGTTTTGWTATDPGAHLKHLTGTLYRKSPIACSECHVVPTSSPGPAGSGDTHGDNLSTVVFSTLARSGGANPADFTVASGAASPPSCSATYCHGGTMVGGTNAAPSWGGGSLACNACHGIPSATNTLGGRHPPVPATQNCNGCHTGYKGVPAGPITVNLTQHINGVVDYVDGAGSCASCHGNPTRVVPAGADPMLTSAPPTVAAPGPFTPDVTADPNGSHYKHLTGKTYRNTVVACSECHAVPTGIPKGGADPHGNAMANVDFGSFSRTGGATAPSFTVAPGGAAPSCSATYCHGGTLTGLGGTNTSPTWNGGPLACNACHGVPPTDTTHQALATGKLCADCHTGTGGKVGDALNTFTVDKPTHLNGAIEGGANSCTSCHGNANRVLVTGADPQAAAAPPGVATPGPYTPDVTADPAGSHFQHLNRPVTGAVANPIACAECHAVPARIPAPGVADGTHNDSNADIVFGPLARTNGSAPASFTVQPTGPAPSCAANYCHGGTMAGGTNTAPTWNGGPTQGGSLSQASCGTCHGLPPATVAKGARPHPASTGTDCGSCHTGYSYSTSTQTWTVNVAQHVNGTVEAATSCTSCHGNSTRVLAAGADTQTASAPPMPAAPTNAPWYSADLPADPSGVHFVHLNRTTGAIGAHVMCIQCHSVPSSGPMGGTDKHGNGTAEVVFGTLARTKTGPAAPAPANSLAGCSATYCHGNFTYMPTGSTTPNPNAKGLTYGVGSPAAVPWAPASPSPLKCGACHVIPAGNPADNPMPQDSCHPKGNRTTGGYNHDGGNSCQSCHKHVTGTATGTATIKTAGLHVDGILQGKCTDCHKNGNGSPWPCSN